MSVKAHFDTVSANYDQYKYRNRFYYDQLKRLVKSVIPKKKRILEIGCGTGEVIAILKPVLGVGIDISPQMIYLAKKKYTRNKNLRFYCGEVNDLKMNQKWDYIILVDVIEHIESLRHTMFEITKLMSKNSTLVITMANPIWEPILWVAEKLNLKMPEGPHNRIKFDRLNKILEDCGVQVVLHNYHLLVPVWIPLFTKIINKLTNPKIKKYAFIEYIIAIKETRTSIRSNIRRSNRSTGLASY